MLGFHFWQDLEGYSIRSFRYDIFAALSLAFLAIPQAVAYSLVAGLPIAAGLYSAIFGTLFTASFCYSRYLISGPSTAVAILIQTTITSVLYTFFPEAVGAEKEALVMHILLQIIITAGFMQILLAFLNVGKVLQFVSRSVMLGYFAGVGFAIFIQQLYYFFGVNASLGESILIYKAGYLLGHIHELHFMPLFVGIFSLGLLIGCKKRFPKFPASLVMLILTGLLAYGINFFLPFEQAVTTLGSMENITFYPKMAFPIIDVKLMQKIFPSAVAIAFLGILEVFSVTRAISAKSGVNIPPNQEVFSLGISNALLSLFPSAMPASASISRSLLAYQMKGKTRLQAIFSSFFIWAIVFFFWPFASLIPLSALSALLIMNVFSIIEKDQVKLCFRATKEDAFSFLLTLGLCLIFTLDVAFIIGITLSIVSYLRKAAIPHFVEYAFDRAGRLSIINPKTNMHRKVRIIGIGGELFFGVVDTLQNSLQAVAEDPHVKILVLRLNGVYHMDASMCLAILRLHHYLQSTKRHLIISGLTEDVWSIFHKSKLVEKIEVDNLFLSDETRPQLSTWKACLRAQELLNKD